MHCAASRQIAETEGGLKIAAKDPLFSVIIPTYCEEQHIEHCLQSIKGQVFEKGRIETIVVDSDSPDNTRAIAQRYADRVVNIKKRGVGKARNVGAQMAKGELLLFLDADTILGSTFIDEIHEMLTDPKTVYVVGTMSGLERFGTIEDVFKFLHYGLVNLMSVITARLGFPFFPTVCCACRKSVFHRVGGFDEGLAIAEDLTLSLKMGKVGKCLVNKKAKAYTSVRRIQKNGVMKNYYVYLGNYFKVFVLNQRPSIQDFPHTSEI